MKSSRSVSSPKFAPSFTDHRGSALLMVLILAVMLGVSMAAAFSYVTQTARLETRSSTRLDATYAAEYALEKAYADLNTLVAQNTANLPTISQTTTVTNLATAPSNIFTDAQGYTWQSFLTVPIEDGATVAAHSSFNPSQGIYQFLSVVEFTRAIAAQAPMHVQFQRQWVYKITPLFQYAIFYNGDLELFPGADFIVAGRVHSNGKIYTGTTASITFNDYVSDVNGLTNQYSPLDPRGPGTPGNNITYNKADPIVTNREEPPGTLTEDLVDFNVNNDGARELIDIPDYVAADINTTERLYNKAGLKILVNSTTTSTVASSGVTVPASSRVFLTYDGTQVPATDPLATYLSAMIATSSMNDYREGATLTTTDIDVSRVTTGYAAGGLPQIIPSGTNWPNNTPSPPRSRISPSPQRCAVRTCGTAFYT